MTFKSLLAAASLVALSAGTAGALTIPATSVVPNGIIPALELQLPGTPALTGNFTFNVETETGNYPNGNNLLVTINLPSGLVFASNLSGNTVVPAANAQGVVNGGGTTGANTVTLLVSLDDIYNSNVLGLALPLRLDACPAAGDFVEVLVRTESGTNIEEGRATTANIIAPCQSAVNGVVASDETTSDTIISLPSYTTLTPSQQLFFSPTPVGSVLGTIDFAINPLVSKSLTAVTPLVPSDIERIRAVIQFEDVSAFDNVYIDNRTAGISSFSNTATYSTTDPTDLGELLDGNPANGEIALAVDGTTQIPTQTVRVISSTVEFVDSGPVDFITSEAGPTGNLDTLQREGREFGFFDWNSGGDGSGTVTVYRITGLTGPTDFTVTLDNSNADGTYTGQLTPDMTGEAILFSTDMGGTLPDGVVRYDALINLETSSTTVDVDRLLSKGGIVTNFGDGANNSYRNPSFNQPSWDSDNLLGSE
ncbi:hypothetical protein [Fretibacter rubidus]|uniref:hypothetical protein n=1 Tax=Fretibacter rubidus TaxID=570162 RepID=UPI00352BBD5C